VGGARLHAHDAVVGEAFLGVLEKAGERKARVLTRLNGGLHRGGVLGEADGVSDAEDGGADGEDAAVDHDVSVGDELAGGGHGAGEAETEDDVVNAALEQADEVFDPVGGLDTAGVTDKAAELLFAEAVVEEELLLLLELGSELGEFFTGFGLTVLARGVVALLERAGLAEAGKLEAEGALHLETGAIAHECRSFRGPHARDVRMSISNDSAGRFAKRQPCGRELDIRLT
jgi:hypothetical protein